MFLLFTLNKYMLAIETSKRCQLTSFRYVFIVNLETLITVFKINVFYLQFPEVIISWETTLNELTHPSKWRDYVRDYFLVWISNQKPFSSGTLIKSSSLREKCWEINQYFLNFLNKFELVFVPNFSLNCQFWFFGPNLPKMGISGLK